MDEQHEPDYFGHFDDLRWALDLPDVKSVLERERPLTAADLVRQWESFPSGSEIAVDATGAYWLFVSLGFCRLYDTALPKDVAALVPCPVPAAITAAALRGLIHALGHLAFDARELPERFDDAEPIEDVALCTSILHQLMQTWAAFFAINDNYQGYLEAGGSSMGEFSKLMREVLDRFDEVDSAVQGDEQMRLLAVATELPLLESWRNILRGSFKEALPWWLDGTVERIAAMGIETNRDPEQNQTLATLLLRRNEQISAQQTEYSLAAKSRPSMRADEDELSRTLWPVGENPKVNVRFGLQFSTSAPRKLRLEVVGAAEHKDRFLSAEIALPGGAVRMAPLSLGAASFDLEPTEIPISAAALIDQHGGREAISLVLAGNRNGGERTSEQL